MSKKQFKTQASSSRASSGFGFSGFGSSASNNNTLSYLTEPPNLLSISDPNVVVAFKNLLKKDSTTKTKGLEDLRSYVQAHPYENDGGAEESLLEAWVKVYPRVSIDNSRRVRELSHSLQYELLNSTRKRMEKYIPKTVGSWLAGMYDRDKGVAKAVRDGFSSFLATDDKQSMFWRRCQPQILEYAQEALSETPETLSDERTVGKDDADSKYYRVIGSSLSLVLHLIQYLSENDIKKNENKYMAMLQDQKLWAFISCVDSFVRRTTAELLVAVLEKYRTFVEDDLEILSQALIANGLRSNQSGSSVLFLQSLLKLSITFPTVWTTAYTTKKTPSSRLRQFVEKGSQGGSSEYWMTLGELFSHIPLEVLPSGLDDSTAFISTYRAGLSDRREPRTNVLSAWQSYIKVVGIFMSRLEDTSSQQNLLSLSVYPLFEQYIKASPDKVDWSLGNNIQVLRQAFELCLTSAHDDSYVALKSEWSRLDELIVASIQMSLPEQSRDYAKSQAAVAAEGHRWFTLQSEITNLQSAGSRQSEKRVLNIIEPSSIKIIDAALDTLKKRNGKPFGAAAVIETSLKTSPDLIYASPTVEQMIQKFMTDDLPSLIISPSSSHLIASLLLLGSYTSQISEFESLWQSAMDGLLAVSDSDRKLEAVQSLISSEKVKSHVHADQDLQDYLQTVGLKTVQGKQDGWTLIESALSYDALIEDTFNSLVGQIAELIDVHNSNIGNALQALEIIAKKQPNILRNADDYLVILTKLLTLSESPDFEHNQRAIDLKTLIDQPLQDEQTSSDAEFPMIHIIQENLDYANAQSLSIETLVNQSLSVLDNASPDITARVFPNFETWNKALANIVKYQPSLALSIMNPLGGATWIVKRSYFTSRRPPRDSSGYSVAMRMALYTSKLLSQGVGYSDIGEAQQLDLLFLLSLSVELANDQLGLNEYDKLWMTLDNSSVDDEVQNFLSVSQKMISEILSGFKSWRFTKSGEDIDLGGKFIKRLLHEAQGETAHAFYAGRILSNSLSMLVERHGWQSLGGDDWLTELDILKNETPNLFAAIAVLSGLQEALGPSKIVNNLCNRLVSDITGASLADESTLQKLIYLNAVLSVYDQGNLPVAQNRIVFAIKHLQSWLESEDLLLSLGIISEICRAMHVLLPAIKEIYGPHWEIILKFCGQFWNQEDEKSRLSERIPAIYSSLKLVSILRRFREANDDLDEAFGLTDELLSQGLVTLLKIPRIRETQSLYIMDDLLLRQVEKIPVNHLKDTTEIYSLLASDVPLIQSAASDILHRVLPTHQEQISFDVLLDKKDAALPDELLSLLLEPPSYQTYTDATLSTFPPPVRSYLLSWHVIFESYSNASDKVRSDYTSNIKTGDYLTPLLNFIFDVLGHSAGQPLNLTKAGLDARKIKGYSVPSGESETPERNMQWLMVHLYFHSLTLLPNLAKNWWIECRSKQTRIAVERWTATYFSPLVIAEVFDEVEEWAGRQQQESGGVDEKVLDIKVSRKAREIFAGYEVDETAMVILIRLAEVYPLEGVKVEGVNRVAVGEKKWQSWLMITQGAITFSNNSLTDGLVVFRKNILSTLAGQTECAICYSLISSDKKMPEKRCQTCKNLFHSACLFRWFASSNQSTCPLCRNPFQYGSTDAAARNARARERFM